MIVCLAGVEYALCAVRTDQAGCRPLPLDIPALPLASRARMAGMFTRSLKDGTELGPVEERRVLETVQEMLGLVETLSLRAKQQVCKSLLCIRT